MYNRAGNMTRIPKPADPTEYYTATYDAWNRLVKIEDGQETVAEYRYDGAKRRIVKKTYVGGELVSVGKCVWMRVSREFLEKCSSKM